MRSKDASEKKPRNSLDVKHLRAAVAVHHTTLDLYAALTLMRTTTQRKGCGLAGAKVVNVARVVKCWYPACLHVTSTQGSTCGFFALERLKVAVPVVFGRVPTVHGDAVHRLCDTHDMSRRQRPSKCLAVQRSDAV
jgi:hypothetical protein